MALSPQRIRDTSFKSARKGYDQAEVDAFVEEVAAALETAQNEATAMEARARAAVARLQELSREGAVDASPTAAAKPAEVPANVDESETISRTLLLAQRTADTTIAEAQAEADRVLALGARRRQRQPRLGPRRGRQAGRGRQGRGPQGRRGASGCRSRARCRPCWPAATSWSPTSITSSSTCVAQRERLVEVVATLTDLTQKVPGGLADMRRPLLSAAAEPGPDAVDADITGGIDVIDAEIAEAELVEPSADGPADAESGRRHRRARRDRRDHTDRESGEPSESSSERAMQDGRQDATPPAGSLFDEDGDATQQIGAVNPRDRGGS